MKKNKTAVLVILICGALSISRVAYSNEAGKPGENFEVHKSEALKEMDERIHVFVPGGQVHTLIWRVDIVIGQAAAHET